MGPLRVVPHEPRELLCSHRVDVDSFRHSVLLQLVEVVQCEISAAAKYNFPLTVVEVFGE